MPHINIEIKARSGHHDKIRNLLFSLKAELKGTDHQIDTYFKVNSGRLKLREGNIENHLIHYNRANIEGPKQSDVTLFKSDTSSTLKEILEKSLGVLVVVDKHREIFFIGNVKFHLDKVEGLGMFVEIEAIDFEGTGNSTRLLEQCQYYQQFFGIVPEDLIAVSYSDLLLERKYK